MRPFCREKLECIYAAVAKGIAGVKGVITPGLCEIAVYLYFQIPDFFVPHLLGAVPTAFKVHSGRLRGVMMGVALVAANGRHGDLRCKGAMHQGAIAFHAGKQLCYDVLIAASSAD